MHSLAITNKWKYSDLKASQLEVTNDQPWLTALRNTSHKYLSNLNI